MSSSEFRPTVETAPEELKLAVHAGGRLAPSPPEAISIANRSSLSSYDSMLHLPFANCRQACYTFRYELKENEQRMNRKQKRTIITLALANLIVLVALAVTVTNQVSLVPADSDTVQPSSPYSSPTPPPPPSLCQWQATQMMAQTGLMGSAILTPGGTLQFRLAYPLRANQRPDTAAQAVWDAFDIALALQQQAICADFTQIEVIIQANSPLTDTLIRASVPSVDLHAYARGTISETTFIERVTYQVTTPR